MFREMLLAGFDQAFGIEIDDVFPANQTAADEVHQRYADAGAGVALGSGGREIKALLIGGFDRARGTEIDDLYPPSSVEPPEEVFREMLLAGFEAIRGMEMTTSSPQTAPSDEATRIIPTASHRATRRCRGRSGVDAFAPQP
ncbi:MAG TPA: hypothetical protein VGB66_09475 [Longimicrobium sp.]